MKKMPTTLETIQGLTECLDTLIKTQANTEDANRVLQETIAQKDRLIENLKEGQEAGESELQQINDALVRLLQTAKSAIPEGGSPAQVESVAASTPNPTGTTVTTENSATYGTGANAPSQATLS
jgi:peptidoglycan hydrolase CwlO-like protein